jgi:ubiquinone/menaquinone biosynthesis C-methylase UbiE
MSRIIPNLPSKWPKTFPPLTGEQEKISDDFMKYWHEVLPASYGIVDRFNHQYVVKNAPLNFNRTLEVGAGNGEHLKYEKLSREQAKNYVAMDIRSNMVDEIHKNFPEITAVVADCQKRTNFESGYFDRVLAIHVLEHLPDLPSAVRELSRLCNKDHGVLSVVIPCEGSFAYSLARKISAQRIFEARYKQSYRWFIEREHINFPSEIFEELEPYFLLKKSSYFPIPFNAEFCNLCIGATFIPRLGVNQ